MSEQRKVRVTIPYAVFVTVELDTDLTDEDEIIEEALEQSSITGYCGNGGSDKIIGVSGSNVSIDTPDSPLGYGIFNIEVEEIE